MQSRALHNLIFLCGVALLARPAFAISDRVYQAGFLLHKQNVISFYDKGNSKLLDWISNCLKDESRKPGNPKARAFVQELVNMEGGWLQRNYSCKDWMDGLRDDIASDYESMRAKIAWQQQFLSPRNGYGTSAGALGPELDFDPELIHPVNGTWANPFAKLGVLEPLSAPEMVKIAESIKHQYMKECVGIWQNPPAWAKSEVNSVKAKFSPQNIEDLCTLSFPGQWIEVSPSQRYLANPHPSVGPEVAEWNRAQVQERQAIIAKKLDLGKIPPALALQFRIQIEGKLSAWLKEKKEKALTSYYNRANGNPLLLLVSSAHPSNQELLQAIEELRKNQEERTAHLALTPYQLQRMEDLRKKFDEHPETFTETEANEVERIASKYRTLDGSDQDVIRIVIHQHPKDEAKITSVIEKYLQKEEKWESTKTWVAGGALVAANIACFLPWGKVMSAAAAMATRSVCLISMGLPVNGYFLVSAVGDYHQHMRDFLTSADQNYHIVDASKLEDDSANVLFNALLFPAGLELGKLPSLLKKIRK